MDLVRSISMFIFFILADALFFVVSLVSSCFDSIRKMFQTTDGRRISTPTIGDAFFVSSRARLDAPDSASASCNYSQDDSSSELLATSDTSSHEQIHELEPNYPRRKHIDIPFASTKDKISLVIFVHFHSLEFFSLLPLSFDFL